MDGTSVREILATRGVALSLASGAILGALIIAGVIMYAPRNQPAFLPPGAATDAKPAADSGKSPNLEKPHDTRVVEEAASAVEALTKTLAPPSTKSPDDSGGGPVFDVARIGPSGDAVIAGRSEPGASVELLRDGVVHAKTIADKSGAFVFVPEPLPPGEYSLTLRSTQPDGRVSTSKKSIAVALHSDKIGKPAAAPPQPKKAEDVVAKADASNSAPASVRVVTVESQGSGTLYVSGQAEPGATVRLYLNGSYIASAVASAAGQVAFSIRSGVVPGDYHVRLDLVDGSAVVRSQAEQSFKAPALNAPSSVAVAQPPAPDPTASARDAGPAKPEPAAPNPAPTTAKNLGPTAVPSPPPGAVPSKPKFVAPAVVAPAGATASSGSTESAPVPTQNLTAGQPLSAPETASQVSAASIEAKDVVVVPGIDTASVRRGDNLWNISRSTYGQGVQYSKIYDANRDQIDDPDLIYPGQIFVLPKVPSGQPW